MRVPGKKVALKAGRWLRSRTGTRAVILGYHRVSGEDWDPFGINVSPANFAEHLTAVRKLGRPISLSSLVDSVKRRAVEPGSICLTFDDGYADWLEQVLPRLARYETPATFFLVAGYLGSPFWWDDLAELFRPDRALPEEIPLVLTSSATPIAIRPGTQPEERQAALQTLHEVFWTLSLEARSTMLERIAETVGVRGASTSCVTLDEARDLLVPGLTEVGSHGYTHRPLGLLEHRDRLEEVTRSGDVLRDLSGSSPDSFSFPHGSTFEGAEDLLASAGYRIACTSRPDMTRSASSPMDLPRLWVPNVDGATFSRWIGRWL